MIVVNEKPNITSLPFKSKKQRGIFSFSPGSNQIDPETWEGIKAEAGDDMHYYGTFLKAIGGGKTVDIGTLGADEAVTLVKGAMDTAVLDTLGQAEKSRKGGPRKTVMEAIEKQVAEIQEIEEKKKAAK